MTSPLHESHGRVLELLNDAADGIREIVQCWNDRLTPQRLVISEDYIKGGVSLVLYLESAVGVRPDIEGAPGGVDLEGDIVVGPIALTVLNAHTYNHNIRQNRNQKAAFVGHVQNVSATKGLSPPLWL